MIDLLAALHIFFPSSVITVEPFQCVVKSLFEPICCAWKSWLRYRAEAEAVWVVLMNSVFQRDG